MNLEEAIDLRRSRRKYLPQSLDEGTAGALRQVVAGFEPVPGGRLELVFDNGAAFEGLRRSYGMFSGVRHYAGLIARDTEPVAAERLGYQGEIFNLTAVTLGLGTCWVGGTFDRSACPFVLEAGETVVCVVVFGLVEETVGLKEKAARSVAHRHSKDEEEMFSADAPVPDWFMAGMRAVQKAPSARNRQPVHFTFQDGRVSAAVPDGKDLTMAVELGIAKLHFETGAGGGTWQWGNNGIFTPAGQ